MHQNQATNPPTAPTITIPVHVHSIAAHRFRYEMLALGGVGPLHDLSSLDVLGVPHSEHNAFDFDCGIRLMILRHRGMMTATAGLQTEAKCKELKETKDIVLFVQHAAIHLKDISGSVWEPVGVTHHGAPMWVLKGGAA